MRIAICDDKTEITKQMREYLLSMQNMTESRMDIYTFNDAVDFTYEIENDVIYDAVFMDIDLGTANGIDLARKVYDKYPATMIAFITAHRQFVMNVFDVQPCGFIEKPILRESVLAVFERILKKCDELPKFSYVSNGNSKCVMLREIIYLRSESRKIVIAGLNFYDDYYGKMDEADEKLQRLSNSFVRISQSYIINEKYIKEISYTEVVLNVNGDDTVFNISQKYRSQVKKWYMSRSLH